MYYPANAEMDNVNLLAKQSYLFSKLIKELFKHIKEPLFLKREKILFDLPAEYFTEKYQIIGPSMQKNRITMKSNEVVIKIPHLHEIPDIEFTNAIARNGIFSIFNEGDMKIAARLIDLLMKLPNKLALLSYAIYIRERINPYLFYYALSVAILHRPDTKDVRPQTMIYVFPYEFVDAGIIEVAAEHAALPLKERNKLTPEFENASFVPWYFSASEREDEQRLAYFREDIAINLHHWHWHEVFPPLTNEIDKLNRRGELFLYMHHEMLARYNSERFSNNLKKTVPLNNIRAVIPEGYAPKMVKGSTCATYPARISNSFLSDLNHPKLVEDLADIERYIDRIIHAIDTGYFKNENDERIKFDIATGINTLGNMIEASNLTPNRRYYGNIHNDGHIIISCVSDPDYRFLETLGVMYYTETAMRDPIFYKWHSFIDSLAIRYQRTLPQYSYDALSYDNIKVDNIMVTVVDQNVVSGENTLITFWQKSTIDISDGLSFVRECGPTNYSFVHLQNEPFVYDIKVTSDATTNVRGTVRIFLGPQTDDRGTLFTFEEQRSHMFQMDKFDVTFTPGQNTIKRKSTDSIVTIPFNQTFNDIDKANQTDSQESNYCGCGWPQHMLLPKGNFEGSNYFLYVMISKDEYNVEPDQVCKNAVAFCGVRDKVYPDPRSMGFPFDRKFDTITIDNNKPIAVTNINEFVTAFKNMGMIKCTIRHYNEVH